LKSQHSIPIDELLGIARDLTASLASGDRYGRLLDAVRRAIPCDAACLLRLAGDELIPLAAHGLADEALARSYRRDEHPRLDIILGSPEPVRFPIDSPLADPFDGLLADDPGGNLQVHACLGCRLTADGELVGALTADAHDAHAFDDLDMRVLATLGALAGAALRTNSLIEALEHTAHRRDRVARDLQRNAAESSGGRLIGSSVAMQRLVQEIDLVSATDLPVLIDGETGVGKELVVHRIHASSSRREEALITINCAALPESIAESELFGHVAGAFTGAVREREGKFEVADRGTLFLDEIGELPTSLQPKLLRALQEGELQRVGSDRVRVADVRIIAATNRDLERSIAAGRFRSDLYHRLAVYPISVPPLRERREDILMLAAHFLEENRRRLGFGRVRLTEAARDALVSADWPGNVRELKNVVSRGALRATANASPDHAILVDVQHLDLRHATESVAPPPPAARTAELPPRSLRDRVDDYRREQIRAALARHDGCWAAVARELGMHRGNLHHLARRLGLR